MGFGPQESGLVGDGLGLTLAKLRIAGGIHLADQTPGDVQVGVVGKDPTEGLKGIGREDIVGVEEEDPVDTLVPGLGQGGVAPRRPAVRTGGVVHRVMQDLVEGARIEILGLADRGGTAFVKELLVTGADRGDDGTDQRAVPVVSRAVTSPRASDSISSRGEASAIGVGVVSVVAFVFGA